MEENFIYDDLAAQGDLGAVINDLQTRNDELQRHVCSLEEDIVKLCDKITEMKTVQENLSKNISELFNTAKNELERKDRRIGELQSQLDEIIFRRRQPHSGFKRKCEESYSDGTSKRPRTETVNVQHFDEGQEILVLSDDEESGRDLKVSMCKNIPGKANPESDIRSGPQQESDHRRLSHSKEGTHSRDKKEYQRDAHWNDYRDRNANRNKTDNRGREMRNDFRDGYRENRDHDRRYRDKSRGRSKGYRSSNHREYRDWRNNRDSHNESSERRYKDDVFYEGHNYRGEKYDDFKYASNLQMDRHPKNEPVFFSGESTQRNVAVAEDDSREEGEVFDEEPKRNTKMNKEDILNRNQDVVRTLPFEVKKSPNTHKFMVNQEKTDTIKDAVGSHQNICYNQDKKLQDLNNKNMARNTKSSHKKKENEIAVDKRVIENCNINAEDIEGKQKKLLHKEIGDQDIKKSTEKNMQSNEKNVTIISQIILNEGIKDTSKNCNSRSEIKNKNQSKIQDRKENPPIVVSNSDRRKRESRVPRNLTDELNINLERSKKTQDLMYELFGSSEKKNVSRMLDQVSPKSLYSLSDEGEIPNLKLFSYSETKGQKSNSNLSSRKNANPVTEFQIFKTNLPCLEKSNSLSSISIQIQSSLEDSQQKDKELLLIEENRVPNEKEKFDDKLLVHQASIEDVEKKENYRQSTNDICSMSFIDLDIRQCKAEDFPNLNAIEESKDGSDSLSTPLQKNFEDFSKKCITQDSKDGKGDISNIHENKLIKRNNEKPTLLPKNIAQIEKLSTTASEEGNEQKNEIVSRTIKKQCQFSSGKDSGQPKRNVSHGMPAVNNEPQSIPLSDQLQQNYISNLSTTGERTEQTVTSKSIKTNEIPKNDSNVTKKSFDPKKASKNCNRKLISPSKIKIHKQSNSNQIKEINDIQCQGNEKLEYSVMDKKDKSSKQNKTEQLVVKESIAQVPNQGKHLGKSTGSDTNKGTDKSSKSVATTDSKDMSDSLTVPLEKNIRPIPKKSTNTGKTGSSKNRSKKDIESCISTSSKKPPRASDKQSTSSLSSTGDEIKMSNSLEAPVDNKVEDISHQKASKLDSVFIEAVEAPQSYKEATKTYEHINCEAAKDVSDILVTHMATTLKDVSQKSIGTNVKDKGASDKNLNTPIIDFTVPNLSVKKEKTFENINLNKRSINQKVLHEASPDKSAESKALNNSDRKRRRCAIKLV